LTLPERPVVTENARSAHFLESPLRTFFSLWVPVLISLIAEPVTGLVDTAFVARLGADSLAALGVGTMVLSSVFWIFNFLSVGSQTEVSQALGRNEMERGTRIASLAMLLALCAGLMLMLLAWLFASPVASAMGATDAVHRQAVVYIRWRAAGAPAVLLTLTAFGVLYGLQDMRMPLWIAVGINALNIVLDCDVDFRPGPHTGHGHRRRRGGQRPQPVDRCRLGRASGTPAARVYPADTDGRCQAIAAGGGGHVRSHGHADGFSSAGDPCGHTAGPRGGRGPPGHPPGVGVYGAVPGCGGHYCPEPDRLVCGSGRNSDARKVAGFVCLWSTLVGTMLAAAMLAAAISLPCFSCPHRPWRCSFRPGRPPP
jgi:hypothetical protein